MEVEHPWQQEVLNEYVAAVRAASARVEDLNQAFSEALPQWSLAPVVCLVALRGVDQLSAITILAELGDISRPRTRRRGNPTAGVPSPKPAGIVPWSRRNAAALASTESTASATPPSTHAELGDAIP